MELEKQVVSLSLAKKLKELGVKQPGALYRWLPNHLGEHEVSNMTHVHKTKGEPYAAFTVAELGEMQGYKQWACYTTFVNGGEGMTWVCVSKDNDKARQYADTEAEVRGLMLIYLLEHNLITNQ